MKKQILTLAAVAAVAVTAAFASNMGSSAGKTTVLAGLQGTSQCDISTDCVETSQNPCELSPGNAATQLYANNGSGQCTIFVGRP